MIDNIRTVGPGQPEVGFEVRLDETELEIVRDALRRYSHHLLMELSDMQERGQTDRNDPDVAGLDETIQRTKDLRSRIGR